MGSVPAAPESNWVAQLLGAATRKDAALCSTGGRCGRLAVYSLATSVIAVAHRV